MANIIPFDSLIPTTRSTDLVVEKLESDTVPTHSKLDFTCAACQNKTTFQISSAVFKTLELFCAQCGTGWKVTNPVFRKRTARKI
jgi:hypothetical protein